jgi:hypothetical protein
MNQARHILVYIFSSLKAGALGRVLLPIIIALHLASRWASYMGISFIYQIEFISRVIDISCFLSDEPTSTHFTLHIFITESWSKSLLLIHLARKISSILDTPACLLVQYWGQSISNADGSPMAWHEHENFFSLEADCNRTLLYPCDLQLLTPSWFQPHISAE